MSGLDLATVTAALAVLLRQIFILTAVGRTARFVHQPGEVRRQQEDGPTFFVVLPVLRESAIIAETVAHFEALVHGHAAQLIVVTTARETAARQQHSRVNTIALVSQLSAQGKALHLHYPDQQGLKGDQLNYAARHCATALLGDVPADRAFLICYDADSRPPLDSLTRFEETIAASAEASVFHQSARFELRPDRTGQRRHIWAWLSQGIAEGAALRANRFVAGFEVPRLLNRSTAVSRLKRRLCSGVYAHVTGHGLCLRLSLLLDLPFPARSPLEDMQYSFYLGSYNLAMVPVPSLDCAEVPGTVGAQIDQAARWFFGPARALGYLRDPATQTGWRANAMAASALGSALEWLGCAIVPAATVALLAFGTGPARLAAIAVVAVYGAQLVITDLALGSSLPWQRRVSRVVLCAVATTLFGIGGFIGAVRLWRGASGVGKTERW